MRARTDLVSLDELPQSQSVIKRRQRRIATVHNRSPLLERVAPRIQIPRMRAPYPPRAIPYSMRAEPSPWPIRRRGVKGRPQHGNVILCNVVLLVVCLVGGSKARHVRQVPEGREPAHGVRGQVDVVIIIIIIVALSLGTKWYLTSCSRPRQPIYPEYGRREYYITSTAETDQKS